MVGAPGEAVAGVPGAAAPLAGLLAGAAAAPPPCTPVAGGVVDAPGPVPGAHGAAAPIVPVAVGVPEPGTAVVPLAIAPLVPVGLVTDGSVAFVAAMVPLTGRLMPSSVRWRSPESAVARSWRTEG